jgi:hypothetical protein
MRGVPDLKIESAMILVVCLLVAFQSTGLAQEQRVQPKVGSFWNYVTTDEIKGTKAIVEVTLTEVNGDELVIRSNLRGQTGGSIWVNDKNWASIEAPQFKYRPNNGQGVPEPLQVGTKSNKEITFSQQLASGWSEPKPMTVEAEILSTETTSTQVGQFETYRYEVTTTIHGSPTQPLSVSKIKNTNWFSPQIDHWVKTENEVRTDGHLVSKISGELLEYRVK